MAFKLKIMTKAIIIIGEETSGKSRLSRDLVKKYKREEIALIDGRLFKFNSAFPFQNVTKETKVLIIDEILKIEILDGFFSIVSGNLIVNQKHKEVFEIKLEKLIIVCDSKIKKSNLPNGASFTRRFEILDTKDFFITEEENNRKIVDYANVYFKEQQDFISMLEQQNQNLSENNKKYIEIINWIKEALGENVSEDYGHMNLNGFIEDFLKDNILEVI